MTTVAVSALVLAACCIAASVYLARWCLARTTAVEKERDELVRELAKREGIGIPQPGKPTPRSYRVRPDGFTETGDGTILDRGGRPVAPEDVPVGVS